MNRGMPAKRWFSEQPAARGRIGSVWEALFFYQRDQHIRGDFAHRKSVDVDAGDLRLHHRADRAVDKPCNRQIVREPFVQGGCCLDRANRNRIIGAKQRCERVWEPQHDFYAVLCVLHLCVYRLDIPVTEQDMVLFQGVRVCLIAAGIDLRAEASGHQADFLMPAADEMHHGLDGAAVVVGRYIADIVRRRGIMDEPLQLRNDAAGIGALAVQNA